MISLRHTLIASALLIAGCAAYFSVSGIAHLFSGAFWSVAVMALSLEVGKLVTVSFLYRYWTRINRALKTYMAVGAFALMLITSAGIYGYLSSAYASVSAEPQRIENEIGVINSNISSAAGAQLRYDTRLASLLTQKQQQENRLDSLIVRSTTGSTNAIRRQQLQLQETNSSIQTTQKQLDSLSMATAALNSQRAAQQNALNTNADIGTFVYLSRALNVPLDVIVKWFVLMIVLVFDPLAVSLIIAYNKIVHDALDGPEKAPVDDSVSAKSILDKVLSSGILKEKAAPTSGAIPYYRQPEYDWEHDDRWKRDPEAIYFKQSHPK